jgi:hypothetical protein
MATENMSADYSPEQMRAFYLDVPAIIAGAVLALAISLILTHFGSAIGLAVDSDVRWTEDNATKGIIATGLWILWIQILASIAGGYLAGRMRQPAPEVPHHEQEMRDGMHGLLVWATGTVAVAIGLAVAAAVAAASNDPDTANAADRAEEFADLHRTASIIFAFTTAASSFVAAAASWWAATMGGEHRDKAVDHSRYVSFRKRQY